MRAEEGDAGLLAALLPYQGQLELVSVDSAGIGWSHDTYAGWHVRTSRSEYCHPLGLVARLVLRTASGSAPSVQQ